MHEALAILEYMTWFLYTIALVAITLFAGLLLVSVMLTATYKAVVPGRGRKGDTHN